MSEFSEGMVEAAAKVLRTTGGLGHPGWEYRWAEAVLTAASAASECRVDPVSSGVCSRGTHSCIAAHLVAAAPDYRPLIEEALSIVRNFDPENRLTGTAQRDLQRLASLLEDALHVGGV